MESFKFKVDLNIKNVTVGQNHRQLLEIITNTVIKAHQEAGLAYEATEIAQFVNENCFIKFVYANIPYSLKIV